MDDEQSKDKPLDHKLVKFLMADFVQTMAELDARKAELDSQIKAATPDKADGDEGDAAEAGEGDDAPEVDETQIKAWKQQLAALKKQIKAEEKGFAQKLNAAVDALDEAGAAELLLTIMRNDMQTILDRYVSAQRQQVVTAFEGWWGKYQINLAQIENTRSTAAESMRHFLKALGYAH